MLLRFFCVVGVYYNSSLFLFYSSHCMNIQLILEQHEFELRGGPLMCGFVQQQILHSPQLVESTDVEQPVWRNKPCIGRAEYKLYANFQLQGG